MMSKKGISEVITTVLIILLAIAAVVIIWSFIRPAITNAGGQVSTQSACFSVQVKPTHCTTAGEVTVQLVSDGGANVTGLVGIAKDDSGNTKSKVAPWNSATDTVGSTQTADTTLAGTTSAGAAAQVLINGKTVTCPQTAATITC